MLSPQQELHIKPWPNRETDSQVIASSRNLRRELRWVAKRCGKFPRKYPQVETKPISRQIYDVFRWLIIGSWTSLNLRRTYIEWPNAEKTCVDQFDLDQSHRVQCKCAQGLTKRSCSRRTLRACVNL